MQTRRQVSHASYPDARRSLLTVLNGHGHRIVWVILHLVVDVPIEVIECKQRDGGVDVGNVHSKRLDDEGKDEAVLHSRPSPIIVVVSYVDEVELVIRNLLTLPGGIATTAGHRGVGSEMKLLTRRRCYRVIWTTRSCGDRDCEAALRVVLVRGEKRSVMGWRGGKGRAVKALVVVIGEKRGA